ncbi:LysR family transcriptional regulator [Achromobacter sp. GbtcB20]|uniref:LysR family transcriptional regulator n=1 Tax=Achromobacter sp. GbtcB20 TaxID=2824765 RepID=UPI001266BDF6|nr:LysR family transcriptional regulator [Achromobacter sp. GbtcB20]
MDRFAALAAFIAVVENGGFSPAARRLGVAPSSLTRQVNALGRSLGTQLLNRSTRALTLTEVGEQYFDDGRRVLGDLERADQSAGELTGPPKGVLRLSVPVAFGRLHVAPFLPAFLAAYPGVRLDIQLTDAVVNLAEQRMDMAIRLGAQPPDTTIAKRLAPHRRVICASPAYLEAHGTPAEPHELSDHNCLLFDYLAGRAAWTLSKGDASHEIPVTGNLRANGSELLRVAALGGAGLVLMPTWLVGEDLRTGRLRCVLSDWTPSISGGEGAIWAVYPRSRRGSRKLTVLIEFLAERFGPSPYWDDFVIAQRDGSA